MGSLKSIIRGFLPRRLKPHRILFGPNSGFLIVTSWHDYPSGIIGYCERALLNWLNTNVGIDETWIDIGAHYGNTSIRMCALVGQKGRVVSFEPNLASAGCLSQTRRLNQLTQLCIVPLGLGEARGLSLTELPEWRGMADSTIHRGQAESFESILVGCFAEIWPQINGGNEKIHGIKIDVQGMEIAVLQGLFPVLLAQRPKLIVEVHRGVSRSDLLQLLGGAGYSREPIPIGPECNEMTGELVDDHIYYFHVE